MKYTHRNGETEKPTMAGVFFKMNRWNDTPVPVVIDDDAMVWEVGDEMEESVDSYKSDTLWWGPVPVPEVPIDPNEWRGG